MHRRIGLLILFALIALISLSGNTYAESNGTIRGRVVNGTHSDKPIAGAKVKLFSVKGQQEKPTRTTTTNSKGFFQFTGLSTGKDYTYLVATLYRNVQYNSTRIQITDGSSPQNVTIRAYETTSDGSAVRISSASMTILATDKSTQSMLVLEAFTFDNHTKRTFVPSTSGPMGQMGLLKFSLPPNSTDLSAIGELTSHQVIQVDKGFGTDLPIRPGQNNVTFTYSVPYRNENGDLEFSLDMIYPTKQFRLLVPENGPKVASPQLHSAGSANVGGTTYSIHTTGAQSAPSKIDIDVSELPVNVWFFRQGNRWLWAATVGLLLLLLAVAIWLSYRGARAASRKAFSGASGTIKERDRLVRAIAKLDEQYESGDIDEQSYRRERELYKQALMTIIS